MSDRVSFEYLDGTLHRVLATTVKSVEVSNLLGDDGEGGPFVAVNFHGCPMLSGFLTDWAAESLFWQLAEIYSPVSVSKLRLISVSPSKMAEKGADHVARDDKSPG